MSTSEGYHDTCGRISWVHWETFSTSEGYHDACGGILRFTWGYHEHIGIFNTSQRLLLICSPTWIMISSQWYPPTWIMISADVINKHYTGWEHSNFNTETNCKWAGHSVNPNICYRVVTGMFSLKQNCGGIWSSDWFLSLLILLWTVNAGTCIYKQYVNQSQVNEAMQYSLPKCQKTNQKLVVILECNQCDSTWELNSFLMQSDINWGKKLWMIWHHTKVVWRSIIVQG